MAKALSLLVLLLAGTVVLADNPRRLPVPPFLNMPPRLPLRPGQWVTVPAFPHLRFKVPTGLIQAPRTNRLFVCERDGFVKSFVHDPNATDAVTVLNLHDHCQHGTDGGLLGMAFHPDFGKPDSPHRGFFYVCYNHTSDPRQPESVETAEKATWLRLSRFTIPDGSFTADPGSEVVLIDQYDEHVFHTGGAMFFHPHDGFLYLAVGDEGGSRGQYGNCQRIDRDLFGGVLRIDVDCDPNRSHPPRRQPATGKTAHYFIPNDNPFVGVANALEEFWCLGLRSPHRMTVDPVTGQVWLGDVGDGGDAQEEVNRIVKGGNYQWNYKEGSLDRPNYGRKPATILGFEQPPTHYYPHDQGNHCVIGGYVYRGQEHAADLGGKYLFGDWGSGRIWTLAYQEGQPAQVTELCALPPRLRMITTWGVDAAGEVYLCEFSSGQIFKLAKAGTPAAPLVQTQPVPELLSQTGAFQDTATLTPAAGLLPYNVNSPLWSDGAAKQRWMGVPLRGGRPTREEQITFAPTGAWKFPSGTVFVKHFDLPVDETVPSVKRRLETRLLVCDDDGFGYGVTYKWRADQSDAELLEGGLTEAVAIRTAGGGVREQMWQYPSRNDCLTCHNPSAGFVLGVNARQLNGGTKDNQLSTWSRLGMFRKKLTEAELMACPRLVAVTDKSASLEHRVRSYFDANCSHCHHSNQTRANFDARIELPLKQQKLIAGLLINDLGCPGARVVTIQDPEQSMLYRRMTNCGDIRMPPLGRQVEDKEATAVVRAWINSISLTSHLPSLGNWAGLQATGLGVGLALAIPLRWLLRGRRRRWLATGLPLLLIVAWPGVELGRKLVNQAPLADLGLCVVMVVLALGWSWLVFRFLPLRQVSGVSSETRTLDQSTPPRQAA